VENGAKAVGDISDDRVKTKCIEVKKTLVLILDRYWKLPLL
jgi:hypothetical protein